MTWRVQQRILELVAIALMVTGIIMMWMRKDPHHTIVYVGFLFLASGKLIEALNISDPGYVIVKITACVCMYLLVLINLVYHVRTIIYLMIPLSTYYALHYRWIFNQRKA